MDTGGADPAGRSPGPEADLDPDEVDGGQGADPVQGDDAIRTLVESNPGQATFQEYKLVHDVVLEQAPCNLLVFGVGRDSALWTRANREGRTVFLEDVPRWIQVARDKVPGITVHRVRYGTLRLLWPLYRRRPDTLYMKDLPPEVAATAWDVILVDAPRGTRWYRPGRMKSVYTASVLGRDSEAHVFVHDCHRKVEAEASQAFLGENNLVDQAGSMRHYHLA